MRPVLDAQQMREADRLTIEAGVPGALLMEKAGAAVARVVRERYPRASRLAILCGKGNNGGDGFVAARLLAERAPAVLLFAKRSDVSGDAATHLQALDARAIQEIVDESAWARVRDEVLQADVIVDALLGTGLREAPRGLLGTVIGDLSRAAAPVVAVDLPSGLRSDAGEIDWPMVQAADTVALAAPKYGHVLPPACERTGRLVIADIGIGDDTLAATRPRLWLLEGDDVRRAYGRRAADAHKGTFGHVLVVGGALGRTGAAVLAGLAALRAGAGLVTVATTSASQAIAAAARPELMTEGLPQDEGGALAPGAAERVLELAAARDALVLGPGLGTDPSTRAVVWEVVRRCPVPLVLDADALIALLPGDGETLTSLGRTAATVMTPHPGEMGRLLRSTAREVQRRRLEVVGEVARATGAVVVLKGYRTLVAEPGGRVAVNQSGSPGLATGGTGDVLAGMIGALLARDTDAWAAAGAAVHLHGLAGEEAARHHGEESMLAGDVVEAIGAALRGVQAAAGPA